MHRTSAGRLVLAALFALAIAGSADAGSVVITATQDNTLYEDPAGTTSNGIGERLFIGRTNNGSLRRALVRFDLSGQIPAGSTITSATLNFNVSRTRGSASRTASLHRVQGLWGEGASNASGQEGRGATAVNGDATWIHAMFPGTLWNSAGGDFSGTVSATFNVGGSGPLNIPSNPQLVSDVQRWVDTPASNAGWIIIGNEAANGSAKRLDSRENTQAGNRPTLSVQFTGIPDELACRTSRVNAGAGNAENVLFLNGSIGNAERIVQVAPGATITVNLAASSSGPNPGPFVMYLQLGAPTSGTVVSLPQGLGLMCFGNPITGGTATKTWNNIGRRNRIGHPDFPSNPAPSTPIHAPGGTNQSVTATLQAIILDDGSAAGMPASVTNAVILQIP